MLRKLLLGLALAVALPVSAAEHWIDVRVPQQFQKEHVDGAVNIPLAELKTRIATEVPNKNDAINVYCNVGRQSGQAQQLLTGMGYTHVVNAGGINQISMPKSASN